MISQQEAAALSGADPSGTAAESPCAGATTMASEAISVPTARPTLACRPALFPLTPTVPSRSPRRPPAAPSVCTLCNRLDRVS